MTKQDTSPGIEEWQNLAGKTKEIRRKNKALRDTIFSEVIKHPNKQIVNGSTVFSVVQKNRKPTFNMKVCKELLSDFIKQTEGNLNKDTLVEDFSAFVTAHQIEKSIVQERLKINKISS